MKYGTGIYGTGTSCMLVHLYLWAYLIEIAICFLIFIKILS
jgi:hypothetical protein